MQQDDTRRREPRNATNPNLGTAIVPPTHDEDISAIKAALDALPNEDRETDQTEALRQTLPKAAEPIAQNARAGTEPIGELDGDEERFIEALEARESAVRTVSPETLRLLKQRGDEFERRQEAFERKHETLDRRLDARSQSLKAKRERKRIADRDRKRKERAKTAGHGRKIRPARAPIPMRHPGHRSTVWTRLLRSLTAWVQVDESKRAVRLRAEGEAYRKRLVKLVDLHTWWFDNHGKTPSDVEIGKKLHCSKDQARRHYELAKELFAPGGPWHDFRTP